MSEVSKLTASAFVRAFLSFYKWQVWHVCTDRFGAAESAFLHAKEIGRVKFSAEKPFAIPFVWRPAALSPMAALGRSLTDTSSSSLAY